MAIAMEYLPETYCVRQVRVEYKHSARYGDILIPKRQIQGNKVKIILENSDGAVCVVTEFTE